MILHHTTISSKLNKQNDDQQQQGHNKRLDDIMTNNDVALLFRDRSTLTEEDCVTNYAGLRLFLSC